MKYVWIVLSLIVLNSSWALEEEGGDPSKSPLGCKNVGYHFKLNTIALLPSQEGERQSLYFFYNRLDKPLKLYQMLGDKTAYQTFLNHSIPSKQWAVLATGEEDLRYICSVESSKKKLGEMVSCRDSVKVCEFARVKFGLNNKGNFWLVTGNSRGGAVAEVVHYGIIPQ